MENFDYISKNLDELLSEISKMRSVVTLVAVTKSGSDEELLALCRAGIADVGENRPQELSRRGRLMKEAGFSPRLHEIGNLQRNKVKMIIDEVALIHSLDSYSLALEINKQAERVGRRVPVLIEINSAGEESKGGIMPNEAEEFFLKVRELPAIAVSGLMTMGPVVDNPEEMRPYFKLAKKIFDSLKEKYGFEGEGILSMGMSDSYAVAIEEGATLVRVGRRLFKS